MQNNRILIFFISLFSSMLILSIGLFFFFLGQNNLSWTEYWNNPTAYGSINIPKLKFTKGIKTLHEEVTFPWVDRIKITVDIELISFVEEERSDILVVYDYRHPADPDYNIDFKAFSSHEELQIIATTKAKETSSLPFIAGNLNDIYRGSITLHLPKNLALDTLSITTSTVDINQDMLYRHANNYNLTSSLGNIDFKVDSPKQMISVDSDLGNVSVLAYAPIEIFDLISNLGAAYLYFKKPLNTLYLINSFGKNTVLVEDDLFAANIQNNVGDIDFFSIKTPKMLNVYSLSGDIFAYINQNSSTYFESVEGKTSSYFPSTQDDNPLLYLYSKAGNIKVLPPSTDGLNALKQKNTLSDPKQDRSKDPKLFFQDQVKLKPANAPVPSIPASASSIQIQSPK